MGYPIPDKPWSTEFAYFLVAVPDDRGFVRAAKGAFTDLGAARVWGEDGWEDDSADAAQRWLDAIAETWRLLEMGWPDDVLAAIDEVEPLLRALSNNCCGSDAVSQLPTSLDPNQDTDLDDASTVDYGSVTYTTVAARLEYKCEACYAMIEAAATTLENFADWEGYDAPLSPEMVGKILGHIPLVGDFVQPAWNYAIGIMGLLWDEASGLNDAASAIRSDEDTIACAMYQADGAEALATAMESAINDAVTGYTFAGLVVDYLPYLMWANLIYEGEFIDEGGNTVDLAAGLTPGTHDCCNAVVPTGYTVNDQDVSSITSPMTFTDNQFNLAETLNGVYLGASIIGVAPNTYGTVVGYAIEITEADGYPDGASWADEIFLQVGGESDTFTESTEPRPFGILFLELAAYNAHSAEWDSYASDRNWTIFTTASNLGSASPAPTYTVGVPTSSNYYLSFTGTLFVVTQD